jgi:hypothetical protein
MVVGVLCVLYLAVLAVHYQTGLREFIWPTPSGTAGYDGQFTYAIARDPLHASPTLDVPAYRYQRILHPLLVGILALGQEPLIPLVMVLTNLAALVIGTAALERLLIVERASRWYALTYGLFGGVFFAVRVGTSEPLAYGLVLLAILAERRNHPQWHMTLLALAAFAKETTLFFALGYVAYYVLSRQWRDVLRLIVGVFVPYALWQIGLYLWLGNLGIVFGGAMATPFEIIPFNGIWKIAQAGLPIFLRVGLLPVGAALVPTLWALWRGLKDMFARRWHPYVFLMLANAAILPFVPFST